MPNTYVAVFVPGKVGEKREDGLVMGELRFAWTNEDGEVKNHRLKSLHKYELEEIMYQLGYREDLKLMQETPETYLESMRNMINMHYDEDLSKLSSGEESEEGAILVITEKVSLKEALEKHLSSASVTEEEKAEEEAEEAEEPKEENIENNNNEPSEPVAEKAEEKEEQEQNGDEELDIE